MLEEKVKVTPPPEDVAEEKDVRGPSVQRETARESEKRPELNVLYKDLVHFWVVQDHAACIKILQTLSPRDAEEVFRRALAEDFFHLIGDERIQWERFVPLPARINLFLENKKGALFLLNNLLRFKVKFDSEQTVRLLEYVGEEVVFARLSLDVFEPLNDNVVVRLLDKMGIDYVFAILQHAGKMGDAVAQKLIELGDVESIFSCSRFFGDIDFRKYALIALENAKFALFKAFRLPMFNDQDYKALLRRALELNMDEAVNTIIGLFGTLAVIDKELVEKSISKINSQNKRLSLVEMYDGSPLNESVLEHLEPESWYGIMAKIDLNYSKELADKILNAKMAPHRRENLLERILHNFDQQTQKYFFDVFSKEDKWLVIARFWDVFKDMGMSDDDLLKKLIGRLERLSTQADDMSSAFLNLRHVAENFVKPVWRVRPDIVFENLEKFSGAGDLDKDERMLVIANRNFKYSLDCPLSEELLGQMGDKDLPDGVLWGDLGESDVAKMYVETWRFRGYLNILKIAEKLNWPGRGSYARLLPPEKAKSLLDEMLEEKNWQAAKELTACVDFLGYAVISPERRQVIMDHDVSVEEETKKRPAYKEVHLSHELYSFYNNMSILGELKGLESGMSRGFSPDDLMDILAAQKKIEGGKRLGRQEQELSFADKIAVKDIEKSIEREVDKMFEWMRQYLVGAVQSELRHQTSRTLTRAAMVPTGGAAIECTKDQESMRRFLNSAEYAFGTLKWDAFFGGKAWAEIAELVKEMWAEDVDYSDKILLIDRAIDIEHNTGMVFDKDARIKFNQEREKKILNKKRYATNSTEMFEQLSEEIHDGELKRKISARIDLLNKIKKRVTSAKGSD